MLVCAFLCAYCTRDRGCSAHPAFPAPSPFGGQRRFRKARADDAPRDREVIFDRHYPRRRVIQYSRHVSDSNREAASVHAPAALYARVQLVTRKSHARPRVQQAPGLSPAPSDFRGGPNEDPQTSGDQRRDRNVVFNRHHPRRRVIEPSRDVDDESIGRGVLDPPPSRGTTVVWCCSTTGVASIPAMISRSS